MTLSPGGAVISGIGMSPIGRRTGIAGIDLTAAAADKALSDAGLAPSDIDGITTMGDTPIRETSARLGIDATWQGGGFDTGGLLSPVMSACLAVSTGRARHVLVYRTVQMMGGTILPEQGSERPGPSPGTGKAIPGMDWIGPLLTMHAYSAANWLAMHCRRHMHLYGTTKEQLGWLAVNSRRNAALNPDAAYREPLTLDDYLEARPISEPFGLYDCDVPVDGSIALVVSAIRTTPATPRTGPSGSRPMAGPPVWVRWDQRPDYPNMAATDAAAEMWSRTDLGPHDVDVAELYDGFTFFSLAWLEALGLCGRRRVRTVRRGRQPHRPRRRTAAEHLWRSAVGRSHARLLGPARGRASNSATQAGERQVAGAEVAAVSVGGGPIAGCMLLTR